MHDPSTVVHALLVGTAYALAPAPLIYGLSLFFRAAPGLAENVDDLSARPDPLPPNLAWADAALRELGFEPIGETAFQWSAVRFARPRSTSRIWKYKGPDPTVSGGIHDKLGAVSFWSVWPGRGTISTGYPFRGFHRTRDFRDLTVQGTNESAAAAYRMHLESVRRAPANAGPPMDLSTMEAVIQGDQFEIQAMRRHNEATYAASRRWVILGIVLISLVTVAARFLA